MFEIHQPDREIPSADAVERGRGPGGDRSEKGGGEGHPTRASDPGAGCRRREGTGHRRAGPVDCRRAPKAPDYVI